MKIKAQVQSTIATPLDNPEAGKLEDAVTKSVLPHYYWMHYPGDDSIKSATWEERCAFQKNNRIGGDQ